ncbi:hypothetical protein BASA81_000576 [Batrachochytrium salamandrivorans]|nr:hypothetical protein BASA81_000576 [Batrachochytrium salamandrivorans]
MDGDWFEERGMAEGEAQSSRRFKDNNAFVNSLRDRQAAIAVYNREQDLIYQAFMQEVAQAQSAHASQLLQQAEQFIISCQSLAVVEFETANAERIAALETLGATKTTSAEVTNLARDEFPRLAEQCRSLARLQHPRTHVRTQDQSSRGLVEELLHLEQPDFDPVSDSVLERLEHQFAILNRVLAAYQDSETRAALVVDGRNLSDPDSIKLLSEVVWRNNAQLERFACKRSKGLRSPAALGLAQALLHCPKLEEIHFDHTNVHPDFAAALALVAQTAPQLKLVSLSRCALHDNGALFWGLALEQGCGNLVSLDLSASKIGPAGCIAIARGLSENKSLRKLDLSFNKIERRGVVNLGLALLKNPLLQELVLNGCGSGSRGACSLAAFIMHPLCKLKRLNLAFNDVGPRGGQALAVGLASNQSLEELVLSGNDFGDEGSAPFGVCLKQNRSLKVLVMADCDMADLGMAGIAIGLETNTTLQVLDCSDQIISNSGCEQLAMRLGLNKHSGLEVLKLDSNAIRSDSAAVLAELLKSPNFFLKELSLANNEIGDRGAVTLSNTLVSLNGQYRLRKLDLSGNPISEQVAETFFARAIAASRKVVRENDNPDDDDDFLIIKADGTSMARGTLRNCGVIALRTKMEGWYYVLLMLVTVGSQWADFISDVLVAVDQVELTVATRRMEDLGYSILIVAFIAIPYVYMLVMYSLPETIDFTDEVYLKDANPGLTQAEKKKRSWTDRLTIVLHSKWTWKRYMLVGLTALQLRPAYEMYLSIRNEMSTLALVSIRLSQTMLESIPQSLIQVHLLFSVSNLLKIQNGAGLDSSIQLLLASTIVSYLLLCNTLTFLFEEKPVTNWKKVAWVHEDAAYWFGIAVSYVYHFAHYLFRSLYIVLLTAIYGTALCLVFLCAGLGSRLALWHWSASSRHPLFSIVSFLVGSATWDTRWAARRAQALELVELAHMLVLVWIPVEHMPVALPALFQTENWALLVTVIGPLALTLVLVLAWAISFALYCGFIESLQPYNDVSQTVKLTAVDRAANQPFDALESKVKHSRQVGMGSFVSQHAIGLQHRHHGMGSALNLLKDDEYL